MGDIVGEATGEIAAATGEIGLLRGDVDCVGEGLVPVQAVDSAMTIPVMIKRSIL